MELEYRRIIENGIVSEDFLKPETICDFLVDEERKKLWAILIDLLVEFDRVCRKYSLRYWLSFGGLLGIVRHQGFIPWDDDLDVCMPREDYEKLKTIKSEFSTPYFLQIPFDDNEYIFSWIKLRNSNTTAVSKNCRYLNFNQGCFLDVFPVDNCDFKDVESNYNKIKKLLITNGTTIRRTLPKPTPEDLKRFQEYPYEYPKTVFEKIESIAQSHNSEQCDLCIVAVCTMYNWDKFTFEKKDFEELIDVDFYGHKISIPKNYDAILRRTYNDYLIFPPIENRGVRHSDIVFDTNHNYKYWIEKLRKADND